MLLLNASLEIKLTKKTNGQKTKKRQLKELVAFYALNNFQQGNYSTVTDFAKFRGWSTSVPLMIAT